jgi:hypothetical protein
MPSVTQPQAEATATLQSALYDLWGNERVWANTQNTFLLSCLQRIVDAFLHSSFPNVLKSRNEQEANAIIKR